MASPLVDALREARTKLASAAVEPGEARVAKRIARELDKAIDRLEGRNADKDLVAIVCHDLKDPLASIVMGSGFLRKTIPPEDAAARRVIDAIARSADRMSQVVGDFHDLARLEDGTLSVERRPCDVVAVLRGAIGPLEAQASEKGVAFELDAPTDPVVACCDHGRLAQIVAKLAGNALKFTAAGGRVVVRVARGDDGALVSVTDTGRGISPDRLATVFDHDANARRMPRDGPGLGLAIVKGLIELQKGTIALESKAGEGTTVAIALPYDDQQAAEEGERGPPRRQDAK
jgi:signal transduction histidine kinase